MAKARGRTGAHRSWRDRSGRGSRSKNRPIARWIFTIGAIGLGVWLWYVTRPPSVPITYVAGLPVVDYEKLQAPPVAFTDEDFEALASLPNASFVSLRQQQTASGMGQLAPRLPEVDAKETTNLILYVSAHGMAEDGKPVLLCSDFDGEGGGRFPLDKLLSIVGEHSATRKLLVLDSGDMAYDPWLGMLINEFPKLVTERVASYSTEPQPFWVLLPAAPLERRQVSRGTKRSLFGKALADGLGGAADIRGGDSNGRVQLDELTRYLGSRMAVWSGQSQIPLLLQAGVGVVDKVPDEVFVTLTREDIERWNQEEEAAEEQTASRRRLRPLLAAANLQPTTAKSDSAPTSAPPATTPEATSTDPGTTAAKTEAPPSKAGTTPADGTAATSPEPPPPAEPVKAEPPPEPAAEAAPDSVDAALANAWQLRDALQNRQGSRWSPVDFAPHLWRKLNSLLVAYESRARGGAAFDDAGAVEELNQLASDLEKLHGWLRKNEQPTVVPHESAAGVTRRLLVAWNQFRGSAEIESAAAPSSESLAAERAIQTESDCLFHAVDFVRWHALASLASSQQVPVYDSLRTYLALLGQERQPVASATHLAQIVPLRDEIQRYLTSVAKLNPRQPANLARMEDLLRTPLLPQESRQGVQASLVQGVLGEVSTTSSNPGTTTGDVLTKLRRRRIADQLQLELDLLRLTEQDSATTTAAISDKLRGLQRASSDEAWEIYRQLGDDLASFYQSLPGAIESSAGTEAGAADSVDLSRRLNLVDPRNADEIRVYHVNRLARRWEQAKPPADLAVSVPSEQILSARGVSRLAVSLATQGDVDSEASVKLEFDSTLVQVVHAGNAVASGAPLLLPLEGSATMLPLEISPLEETGAKTSLTIHVSCGELSRIASVGLRLPLPDVVDLVITEIGPGGSLPAETDTMAEGLRLRPLPNRPATFQLALANRSGIARQVEVVVLAVPAPSQRFTRPGRLFDDDLELVRDVQKRTLTSDGQPWPNVRLLAKTAKPVDLPAGNAPVQLVLAAPGAGTEAAKSAAEATPPAAEPKEETKEQPGVDITEGLLCLVRQVDDPDARWAHWIELLPLEPRDYIQPEVSYDQVDRQIRIDLGPAPNAELAKRLGPEGSIRIAWTPAPGQQVAITKNEGLLAAPRHYDYLAASVNPAPKKVVEVRLSVDGYPRSFVYQVECNQNKKGFPRERSLRAIRVLSPSLDEAFKAPQDALRLALEVDVPEDAFLDDRDRIEVGISGERATFRSRFWHRRLTTKLVEVSAEGYLTMANEVGDFNIDLPTTGFANKRLDLFARLFLHPEASNPTQDVQQLTVVFDRSLPQIAVLSPGGSDKREQGDVFRAEFTARDLFSGIDKVQWALVDPEKTELSEADKPQSVELVDPDSSRYRIVLETKDLDPKTYKVLIKATDRVGLFEHEAIQLAIALPAPKPAKPPPPTKGTIIGSVVDFDGKPLPRIEVKNDKLGTFKTGSNGKFVIKDVKPGEYTLKATGTVKNLKRQGEVTVEMPSPPPVKPVVAPSIKLTMRIEKKKE